MNEVSPKSSDPILELQRLGHSELTAKSLLDERVVKVLQKLFRNNELQKQSPEFISQLILDKAKGKSFEWMLKDHPKVLSAIVDVIRDKEALASLIGIFLRKGDLKTYFFIWIGLMILGHLIKRFVFSEDWGKGKRFVMSFLLSLTIGVTSLTIFYNIFDRELSPTAKILITHWKNRNS